MQFAIPQFTDVEDKLIGPLTLKQFLSLLATGGVALLFWSLFGLSIIFFLFALPVVLLGIVITFAKFNGRSYFVYVMPFLSYSSSAKVMIYRREGVPVSLTRKSLESHDSKPVEREGASEGRLRKLAYVLDQKTVEEGKLIGEIK